MARSSTTHGASAKTRANPEVAEVLERLERIETRIEDMQHLVDLQLEGTADLKTQLREQTGAEDAS